MDLVTLSLPIYTQSQHLHHIGKLNGKSPEWRTVRVRAFLGEKAGDGAHFEQWQIHAYVAGSYDLGEAIDIAIQYPDDRSLSKPISIAISKRNIASIQLLKK